MGFYLGEMLREIGFAIELLACCGLFMAGLKKRSHLPRRVAAGILINLAVTFITALITPGILIPRFFLRYIAGLLFVVICCDISGGDALYCSVCAYVVQHLNASVVVLAVAFLENPDIGVVWYHPVRLLFTVTIYTAVYFLAARQMSDDGEYRLGSGQALIYALLVLTVTLVLSSYAGSFLRRGGATEDLLRLYLLCSIYDAFCCGFMLFAQTSMRKEARLLNRLSLSQQLWYKEKAQYELAKENIEIINRKCHDLKHQVAALERMGPNDRRSAYLQEIKDSIQIYDSSVKTGNEVLDTVLTEKSLVCAGRQISMTCMADGSHLAFMDQVDLYTILGNAVDNAIESVSGVPDEEKRLIAVSIFARKSLLFIQVENYYEHRLVFRDGLPVSTKARDGYHGYGLKSIRYTAEKYGGFITINSENQLFLLRITIPLE